MSVFDFRVYSLEKTMTPDNTAPGLWRMRALTIFSELFLSQLVEPSRQPASAAACRRVLEPDILEVSHLSGCVY
jgi:hypothetical protein